MFARKARRAWGLAERTNQPTTVRSAHSELSPSRTMLEEAVVRSVPCPFACARAACFESSGERWLCPSRRVMLRHSRQRLLGPERAWQTRGSRSRSPGRTRRSRCREPGGACVCCERISAFALGCSQRNSMVPRGRPGGGWRQAADARGRLEQLSRSPLANGANRSRVVGELALRRDSHPKPECHRRRVPRHEARGLGYWF